MNTTSTPGPHPTMNASENPDDPDFWFYDDWEYDDGTWLTEVSITNLVNVITRCGSPSGANVWMAFKVFILLTALPANTVLVWLLYKSRHNFSPSQLLAFNISILDILYCVHLPFQMYVTWNKTSRFIHNIRQSLSTLNLFGCPMFLTLMCLERYVAVAYPILYSQLGKWNHRIVLSLLAWVLTVLVAVLACLFDSFAMKLSLGVMMIVFFLIMLLCLVGIMRVLCQVGPGGDASSNLLKKQALCNVISVIIPSVIAYIPLAAEVGYLSDVITRGKKQYTGEQCTVLHFLLLFPNFGLYIGPLFYLARIRKISCCSKEDNDTSTQTQLELRTDV